MAKDMLINVSAGEECRIALLENNRREVALAVLLMALAGGHPASAKPLRIVLSSPLVDLGSGPDNCTPAISGVGALPYA